MIVVKHVFVTRWVRIVLLSNESWVGVELTISHQEIVLLGLVLLRALNEGDFPAEHWESD